MLGDYRTEAALPQQISDRLQPSPDVVDFCINDINEQFKDKGL